MSTESVPELTEESVEHRLAELLDQERFPPPEGFVPNLDGQALRDLADEKGVVGYWEEQARRLRWTREWDTALDDSDAPFFKWFQGGTINVSDNCVDRHVDAGAGDRVAFHWHGEQGETRDITYADLLRDVQRFANVLKDRGVGKGDVVGIFLPMIPEVVVAMLACARIGAIAQRRLRRLLARRRSSSAWRSPRAKAPHHRRRRPAQGEDRAETKEAVDEVDRWRPRDRSSRPSSCVDAGEERPVPMTGRPRRRLRPRRSPPPTRSARRRAHERRARRSSSSTRRAPRPSRRGSSTPRAAT